MSVGDLQDFHKASTILPVLRSFTIFLSSTIAALPLFGAFCAPEAMAQSQSQLHIVYPKDGASIEAPSTFVIGNTTPGNQVSVNAQPITVNAQGLFAGVIKLKPGQNSFSLKSGDAVQELKLKRPEPRKPIDSTVWTIDEKSAEPKESLGLVVGDVVTFKIRATPGSQVSVLLENRVIALQAKASPDVKIDYGKIISKTAPAGDIYVGYYKIQAQDQFQGARPKFVVKKDGKELSCVSAAALSVVLQPRLAETIHDQTIVRAGPGQARLTPLPAGVKLVVDGYRGKDIRLKWAENKHVFIEAKDLRFSLEPHAVSGQYPNSAVKSVNIEQDSYGDKVILPLTERLPFEIEQFLKPNRLVVKVYGATADTDWSSQEHSSAFEGSDSNIARNGQVHGTSWKQLADGVYELTINIAGNRQWGYYPEYEGENLVIHVRDPIKLRTDGPACLTGLKICVDPGHGGPQPGASSCAGISEAEINLKIGLKLKEILEKYGATVIMTRTTDVDVDLAARCEIARKAGAQMLLSVHNNSLPDGRNPIKEHGSSTYFYHPQSVELAQTLKNKLLQYLGFPDIGSRYQNLALTRPSEMPAVLAEIGFVINPDECAQLIQPEVQEKAAKALADGIVEYLGKPQ